jgi:hypothetical protein
MTKSLSEFVWGHLSRLPEDVVLTVTAPAHDRLRADLKSDRIPAGVYVLNSSFDQFEVSMARMIVLFQGLQSDLEYLDMTWAEYSAAMPKKRENAGV